MIRDTTVVIPVMGITAEASLPYALDALCMSGFRRVMIVDAGDGDECVHALTRNRWAQAVHVPVQLTREFNRGLLLNAAVTRAHTRFVAFCDADMIPNPDFVSRAAWMLEGRPNGCVFANVYYSDRREAGQFCLSGTPIRPPAGKHRRKIEASGGFNWLRVDDFIHSGGFRPDFTGWYGEEQEFGWRWAAQSRPVLRPETYIVHLWHTREGRRKRGYFRDAMKNRERFCELKRENAIQIPFTQEGVEPLGNPRTVTPSTTPTAAVNAGRNP